MDFQTVYVVTDDPDTTRAGSAGVLLFALTWAAVWTFVHVRAAPRPDPTRTPWRKLRPAGVAVAVGGLCVVGVVAPRSLERDDALGRYVAGDYQTTTGRVDRVEREAGDRPLTFRFEVGGRVLRYRHDRDRGRLAAAYADQPRRFGELFRGRVVRVRHVGERILQFEIAGGP